MKKIYFLYAFILILVVLTTAIFMTPAITDECSDMTLECIEKAAVLDFWDKSKEGFSCVFRNIVCVFGNIGNIF